MQTNSQITAALWHQRFQGRCEGWSHPAGSFLFPAKGTGTGSHQDFLGVDTWEEKRKEPLNQEFSRSLGREVVVDFLFYLFLTLNLLTVQG